MTSTSKTVVLALAVPVYGKRVKAMRKKMKAVPVLYPSSDEGEEVIDAAPTCHAGIRKHVPQLPIYRNWSKSVGSSERKAVAMRVKAQRKMKAVRALSPAMDGEGDEKNDVAPTCSVGSRRRVILGKESKSVDPMERAVTTKRVKAKRRKKVTVLSPVTNEEGEEEIHAIPSCYPRIRRRRTELPVSQKEENGGVDSMKWVANAIKVKAERKTKNVSEVSRETDLQCEEEIDAVSTCNISRRRRTEFPLLKKRILSAESMATAVAKVEGENEDPARSFCTSHDVKKACATACLSSRECQEAIRSGRKWKNSSRIPAPALKKMACIPTVALGSAEAMDGESVEASRISQQILITNMIIKKNNTGRAKKKLQKNNEVLKMMIGEDKTEEENPSCSNGGINRLSLESFANMVKGFRYTGNKRTQEHRSCVESEIAATSANVTSTNFRDEKASCNGTMVANGALEETENRSMPQLSLCFLNIPERTPQIATTSSTTLNHNKRITTFENNNTILAINPLLVAGLQDEDLTASVSKKMKRQHQVAAIHTSCPALVHEPASQKTKKHGKMASFSAADEVDKTRKLVRCKHRETMTKAKKMQDSYRRVVPENNWVPPNSPYQLLQEDHAFDPWRVLVICMLLNQTTGGQVTFIDWCSHVVSVFFYYSLTSQILVI